jgi:protein tyrosine/serine phosphatase
VACAPLAACATTGTVSNSATVANFGIVDDGKLFRGARPDQRQVETLVKTYKVQTIINLEYNHQDLETLRTTKLQYVWIPEREWNPILDPERVKDDLVRVFKVLSDASNLPAFVHCREGKNRTGVFVAAYRKIMLGQTDQAWLENDMDTFGLQWFWGADKRFIAGLDVDDLKKRVNDVNDRAMPVVVVVK